MSLQGQFGLCSHSIHILIIGLFVCYSMWHTKEVIPVCMCVTNWNHHRQQLFSNCLESLFTNTDHSVSLHLIVDETSMKEARALAIRHAGDQLHLIQIHYIESIYTKFQKEMDLLREYFGSKKQPYYQDIVFYVAPIIHTVVDEEKLIFLDTDTKILADLYDLYNSFGPHQYWGAAPEQSPYYRVVLDEYKTQYPDTPLGDPPLTGFPGINTGVLLVNIEKMRQDTRLLKTYFSETHYRFLIDKYMVRGNVVLGGQDFLSLMRFEYPEMFHDLHCSWNRQLCMWFKENGFSDVFDLYYECLGESKILHGNCNTTIPAIMT